MPTMSNESGTICISKDSIVIDYFNYNEKMHFPLLNNVKGVSLERIHFDRPTTEKTNWHSASETAGFATPGYENSQFQIETITENEISISPELFSPNGDGYNDVVNVNLNFNKVGLLATILIFDSYGRIVKELIKNELISTSGTYSWDGINEERAKAAIGIYIIYIETVELNGTVNHYKKTCVLAAHL